MMGIACKSSHIEPIIWKFSFVKSIDSFIHSWEKHYKVIDFSLQLNCPTDCLHCTLQHLSKVISFTLSHLSSNFKQNKSRHQSKVLTHYTNSIAPVFSPYLMIYMYKVTRWVSSEVDLRKASLEINFSTLNSLEFNHLITWLHLGLYPGFNLKKITDERWERFNTKIFF